MCGIVSYIDLSGNPISPSALQSMTDIVSHRGPDDQGTEVFCGIPFVALGDRRLSIIDLSPAGRQPMSDKEGLLWIVFNGEIFNFKELRQQLQGHGYSFRSNSDRGLNCAYKEWEEKCLEKLNGMFAFAIWDSTKRELFGARDRIGIKPFYYYHQGDTLMVASEIRPSLPQAWCLQNLTGPRSAHLGITRLLRRLVSRHPETRTGAFHPIFRKGSGDPEILGSGADGGKYQRAGCGRQSC